MEGLFALEWGSQEYSDKNLGSAMGQEPEREGVPEQDGGREGNCGWPGACLWDGGQRLQGWDQLWLNMALSISVSK